MEKEYKRDKWVLTHHRYIDDMGFEVDSFDLFDTEARVHHPFMGYPKVANVGRDFPINKIPYDYTEEDYAKMMDEQLAKLTPPPKSNN